MNLDILPPPINLDTVTILKKLTKAHKALAELNGKAETIPNESILINTLVLQEAKDSSAIENIVTTHSEIFQSNESVKQFATAAAKEVHNYASGLRKGFELVRQNGFISVNHILQIQSFVQNNNAGIRKLPDTNLINESTGEIIYVPPQDYETIIRLLNNLEQFINQPDMADWDPLIKMAIIHHQFESIHPFYDGNGRTGRILNILYLINQKLLSIPILYMSRYIINNKADYYRFLQEVRTEKKWENWILFMLEAVEKTSLQTIQTIYEIKKLMTDYKNTLRNELPKLYSQDLLNNLFKHPYTKIEFVMNELNVGRITATRYLEELVKLKLVEKQKIGRDNYYINKPLYELLSNIKG